MNCFQNSTFFRGRIIFLLIKLRWKNHRDQKIKIEKILSGF